MKNLFKTLIMFLLVIIIGCQESSITDPVSDPEVMKLDGMLYDPSHYFNSFAEIKGTVTYSLDQIQPEKGLSQSALKVQLYVNAAIRGGHTSRNRPWTVDKTAEDIVYLSPATKSGYFLEKSFTVSNTCCAPLILVIMFQVDDKLLTLVSMELK
jgi:hypothetical protein